MTNRPHHPEDPPHVHLDPIPAAHSAGIEDVDTLLAAYASEISSITAAPGAGLADRVYDASVGHLPRQLRLVGTAPAIETRPGAMSIFLRRAAWARIALAASVAVAFVAVMKWPGGGVQPQPGPHDTTLAHAGETTPLDVTAGELPDDLGEEGVQYYVASALQPIENEIGHLMDTMDLDSYDDVEQDFASLLAANY